MKEWINDFSKNVNKKQKHIFECELCDSFLVKNDKFILDKNMKTVIVCDECFMKINNKLMWEKRFLN